MPSTTTTIRLPDRLKARVVRAARANGATSHAFILQAIAEKAEREELRSDFERTADERWKRFLATGKAIPWQEMRAFLMARASGRPVPRPKPRRLGR
jgi:predicted transcriptional regulator